MADYIKREDAKALFCKCCESGSKVKCWLCKKAHPMDAIPAADVRSVVHAEWILVGRNLDGTSDFECSACLGMLVDVPDDDEHDLCAFCPNCGAKMEV